MMALCSVSVSIGGGMPVGAQIGMPVRAAMPVRAQIGMPMSCAGVRVAVARATVPMDHAGEHHRYKPKDSNSQKDFVDHLPPIMGRIARGVAPERVSVPSVNPRHSQNLPVERS